MNGQIVKETVFVTLYFTTRLMGAGETTLGDKDSDVDCSPPDSSAHRILQA